MKILVVKNRAYGDSIIGLGAIDYIKECFPDSKIVYGIPKWIMPLYEKIESNIDDYLAIDIDGVKDWVSLLLKVRKEKYDFIIDLHQKGRTGKFFNFYSKISGTPYFFHNHNISKGTFVLDQGKRGPAIQRDLNGIWPILVKYGITKAIPDHLNYCPNIKVNNVTQNPKHVILGVVAGRPTKKWPLEYFMELTRLIEQDDPEIVFYILISSFKKDEKLVKEIERVGFPQNTQIKEIGLKECPEFFAEAGFYVGNDTGHKHLSVALGLKTITLFGPEEPLEWHPYETSKHPFHYIEEMSCRIIRSHFCSVDTCDHLRCLKMITPQEVFKTFKKLQ